LGATTWWFVSDPAGTIRRQPAKHMRAFVDGEALAPHPQLDELLAVKVLLTVECRRIAVCHDVCPIRYRLTDAGYVDADHQWNAVVLGVQLMDLPEYPDAIHLGPEVARREIQRRHRWRPTSEQARVVANTLNAAAVRAPVVVVTHAGLTPV